MARALLVGMVQAVREMKALIAWPPAAAGPAPGGGPGGGTR
ncbi:MAG TPA: hypothetical protein VNI61_10625 [Gemmatimonadales bacterium]|nr:hypothetical protein [Gemmatimonadales bacterium]